MPNFSVSLSTYTAYADGTVHGADPTAALDTAVSDLWSAVASILHGNAGQLSFLFSRVTLTATGTARIHVARHGGFQGAVSCKISTYDTTGAIGMNSTTHFTPIDLTVSFAAGEAGVKYVDITVGTSPGAGLHMFGVEMTTATGGVKIRHPNMHVYFDDGGVNTSATIVTATVPADLETTVNAASAGDLIYARSTGGDYVYNNRTSGENIGGYTFSNTSGTKTAPIIVANYPGETPKIDQAYAYTHDRLGHDMAGGIHLINGASYIHIKGFEITRTLFSGISTDNSSVNEIVVEDCNVHEVGKSSNYSVTPDNLGAVALGFSTNSIIRNNQLNTVYKYIVGGGGSNNVNAEPYELHSGIHGYQMKNLWVHGNEIHTCRFAVYGKHPRQDAGGADFHHVHHNFMHLVEQHCVLFQTAGSGSEPGHNILVHDNVGDMSVTSSADTALVSVAYADNVVTQPDGLVIFNNTLIDGWYLYVADAIEGIVSYNNLQRDSSQTIKTLADSVRTYNNQINYCDYNCYNNIISMTFLTGEGGSPYTSLASWQAALSVSADPQLDNDPDANSITTAPTFVNEVANDYRTLTGVTVGTGRFGRDIGIGDSVVGVV